MHGPLTLRGTPHIGGVYHTARGVCTCTPAVSRGLRQMRCLRLLREADCTVHTPHMCLAVRYIVRIPFVACLLVCVFIILEADVSPFLKQSVAAAGRSGSARTAFIKHSLVGRALRRGSEAAAHARCVQRNILGCQRC